MDNTKTDLKAIFKLKDMGELHITGYEIQRDNFILRVSQKHYITLNRSWRRYKSQLLFPWIWVWICWDLQKSQRSQRVSVFLDWFYTATIRSLMWAAIGSRPDIAHTVSMVAQYTMDPEPHHQAALKCILRYLRGSPNLRISFSGNDWAHLLIWTLQMMKETESPIQVMFLCLQGKPSLGHQRNKPQLLLPLWSPSIMQWTRQQAIWLWHLLAEIGLGLTAADSLRCQQQHGCYWIDQKWKVSWLGKVQWQIFSFY